MRRPARLRLSLGLAAVTTVVLGALAAPQAAYADPPPTAGPSAELVARLGSRTQSNVPNIWGNGAPYGRKWG